MPRAARASRGAATIRAPAATMRSNRRLATAQRPPNGHEGFRRIETLLIAPRMSAVTQGLERAGMGIGAELAGIASHRLELALEGGGDIDPRIGGEAARIRPFSAAGRVECVDGSNATF